MGILVEHLFIARDFYLGLHVRISLLPREGFFWSRIRFNLIISDLVSWNILAGNATSL